MILLIDNYDSFTFNVKHYFLELGAEVKVFRNDEISIDKIDKNAVKSEVIEGKVNNKLSKLRALRKR